MKNKVLGRAPRTLFFIYSTRGYALTYTYSTVATNSYSHPKGTVSIHTHRIVRPSRGMDTHKFLKYVFLWACTCLNKVTNTKFLCSHSSARSVLLNFL